MLQLEVVLSMPCASTQRTISMLRIVFLLALALMASTYSLEIEEVEDTSDIPFVEGKLQYELTSGSSIGMIDRPIYTEEDTIMFSIPKLPDLQPPLGRTCSSEASGICRAMNDTNNINSASYALHKALRHMFSTTGLNSVAYNLSKSALLVNNVNDKELNALVKVVGSDWYQQAEAVLSNKALTIRQKRGIILPILAKAGVTVAPMLVNVMKNLFNTKKDILKSLLNTVVATPRRFFPFLKFASTISELAALEGDQEAIVKNQLEDIKRVVGEQQRRGETLLSSLTSCIFDVSYLVHQSLLYSIHSQALSACRANEIPITFISPNQLIQKLEELEEQLPFELELVWGPGDYMKYYKSDSAHCSFHEEGGLVTIVVPLRPRKSNFVLYRFQGLSFGNANNTCDFELPSSHIIKDLTTSTIYPITDLDEDLCSPNTQEKCKVPAISAADTPQHMCVRAILTEASVSVLKKVCKMSCREDTTTLPVQITDSTVVVTNLPNKGAEIRCGKKVFSVEHSVDPGALKISLGCGCKLILKGKMLAQSMAKACARDFIPYEIVALLPAQWTNLENWRAQPHDRDMSKGVRFDNIASILEVLPPEVSATVGSWFGSEWEKVSCITGFGQISQAAATAYIIYKIRRNEAAIAFLADRAAAAGSAIAVCNIPLHAEIVLYLTFVFVFCLVAPKVVRSIINCFQERWLTAVQRAAIAQMADTQR